MEDSKNWELELIDTLKTIENERDYILVIGACYVSSICEHLKNITDNKIFGLRIQDGHTVKDYHFEKLRPSAVFLCLSFGVHASVLENDDKFNKYVNTFYQPILSRIAQIQVPTLIIDFPGCLDRYCNLNDCRFSNLTKISNGLGIPYEEAVIAGWNPQPAEQQEKRKEKYKQICIYPLINNRVSYFDLQQLIKRHTYSHNMEVRNNCVGLAPWHWDETFKEKVSRSFNLFLNNNLKTSIVFICKPGVDNNIL